MKTTRRLLAFLLPCLLVAIQQLGFAHALSHLANTNPDRPSRNDTPHPAEKVCIECVAFAQIGAGLSGHAPAAPAPAAALAVAAEPLRLFDPEFIPAFRSRAPPSLV